MSEREISYYSDYVTEEFFNFIKKELKAFDGVEGLSHHGPSGGLENQESLKFVVTLYEKVKPRLKQVLDQRKIDRSFIDERMKTYHLANKEQGIDFLSKDYQTVLGDVDSTDRIVIGPKRKNYCGKSTDNKVAPIPEFLDSFHVTLFGPPDDPKLSINAMNAYHRKLKEEPAIVEEILKTNTNLPMWGADDEDSKTPMREDLINASINLTGCFNGDIKFEDKRRGKSYELVQDKLAQPIKRFPGLALPCTFMYYHDNPLPLHLYDFALHLFHHWHNPKALCFYVPKLENEEEAAYIKHMIETAEHMIKDIHSEYEIGTVRVIIVLENPRAVFRVNEMMDELYPYFVGASLGWHDYLGSTARLFKEDGNYRIPVKADPDIVIKYIKASHELLANVVGERGGIKIGGMYGILPLTNDLFSDSFQITIRGFFRDVLTQLKRNLSGYWVAHPDFIRIGIAIVEAWKIYKAGDETKLQGIINGLLNEKYSKEIWEFVEAKDIESLDLNDEMYARSLIVADIKESNFIANNHPDEVRYNVFQMLQYLTDWLSGNGCVALPTQINGIPARVMDDLATAERSRWEVWHEIYHGRFSVEDFIQIAHEEMNFIRRDLSDEKKIVQIKYTPENAKWYDVALKLMIQLMTNKEPVEFATELLLPFTIESIRKEEKPWVKLHAIDPNKYFLEDYVNQYNYYFEMCGSHSFAKSQVANIVIDEECIKSSIMNFNKKDILLSASFHGDIGQNLASLDEMAKAEQAKMANASTEDIDKIVSMTSEYQKKFGMKYLVSAKGKAPVEILSDLEPRLKNTEEQELENAKKALLEITLKRVSTHPLNNLKKKLSEIFNKFSVQGCQVAISTGLGLFQTISFGKRDESYPVTHETQFEIASLSKTFASVYAHELLKKYEISLESSVNELLLEYGSEFQLKGEWAKDLKVHHLMSHNALNMHYVNGVPSTDDMPEIDQFLNGNEKYDYKKIEIINKPGEKFKYSGAGFILLEYLLSFIEEGEALFNFSNRPHHDNYAKAYNDENQSIGSEYKMFPAFAAGMWNTAEGVNQFLEDLAFAYNNLEGKNRISHDTAVQMTHGFDKGCLEFMNAFMGRGIFTIEAGDNEFLLHQGANDGYRAIFLYCYKGPDKYKGLTILCIGELNGVLNNAMMAQEILKVLKVNGIDYNKYKSEFDPTNLSQEEIVNIGYKELVLNAFERTLPEKIIRQNPKRDELADFNLLKDAKIIACSNQRFARAENLLSLFEPEFDPALFGKQGKIMDSWESARHNPEEYDSLKLSLKEKAQINYLKICTKYHFGNQVEWIEIIGDGNIILEKTLLAGHAKRLVKLKETIHAKEIEIRVYPDGGLSRVGLYSDIPEVFKPQFELNKEAHNIVYEEAVPVSVKPLGTNAELYKEEGNKENLSSSANGAHIISATDEHYAPASLILSPYRPLNMFDGLESKRSRVDGHKEEVVIKLSKAAIVRRMVLDFTFFVNNNPKFCSLSIKDGDNWIEVVDRFHTKPYAGNKCEILFKNNIKSEFVKLNFFPDGGVNRVFIYENE